LVALGVDLPLGQDGLGVVAGGGQQVNGAVPGTAAAQGLAVHGQPEQGWSGGGGRLGWLTGGQLGQVGAGGGIEGVAVQTGQQPAQGGGGQPDRGRETE